MTDGAEAPFALSLRGIHKRFGDVVALRDASLDVRPGTIHAVLGENGAGKSTLMQIAYGILEPDAGAVHPTIGRMRGPTPRRGVGMVHQHLSLVPALTALENFQLGAPGRFDRVAARKRLMELADASGLHVEPELPVRDMSIVQQQRLEILKALGRDATVLILDEPTAVLAPAEARDLMSWVRDFARGNRSVVLVTHKLREAIGVADEITVLRRGAVTWTGPAATTSDAELARAIFPEHQDVTVDPPMPAAGASIVSARDVRIGRGRKPAIDGASFELRGGDLVGVAAVEGNGQHELLLALAGRVGTRNGTLSLPAHIAYVPADRKRDAIIPPFSLTENVALHGAGSRRGTMPWRDLTARTTSLIQRFSIAAPNAGVPVGALSGGNQQRLVVARELEDRPELVVADNPTRGLDLRATAFVLGELRACAAAGSAVIIHSSDLDELLGIATRVFVVFHGRVREVRLDRDVIGRAMLGAE